MRSRALVLLSAFCYYTGLLRLISWWTLRSGNFLIILNYHRAEGDLRRHLLYLRRHFRLLNLEMALLELYSTRAGVSLLKDRRPRMVLTFDDGYRDNYTHALRLAQELHIPMTIFLIPGYVGCGNSFWWLDRLLLHARVNNVSFEGRDYHLERQEERKALALAIDAAMSRLVSAFEKEELLTSIRKLLAIPSSLALKEEPASLLGWEEVREMEASGWISFGAHTMHHPHLGYLPDHDEMQREVSESRSELERQLGHPVRSFAYPYGKPEHIGMDVITAVQRAGYDCALTTSKGYNTSETDPYLLKRIFTRADQHWLVIAAKTSGAELILAKLYRIRQFFVRRQALIGQRADVKR